MDGLAGEREGRPAGERATTKTQCPANRKTTLTTHPLSTVDTAPLVGAPPRPRVRLAALFRRMGLTPSPELVAVTLGE